MTACCDIRRAGPGDSVHGGERRACCGAPSCRQGQGVLLRAAAPGLNVRTPWLCLVTRENGRARPFG